MVLIPRARHQQPLVLLALPLGMMLLLRADAVRMRKTAVRATSEATETGARTLDLPAWPSSSSSSPPSSLPPPPSSSRRGRAGRSSAQRSRGDVLDFLEVNNFRRKTKEYSLRRSKARICGGMGSSENEPYSGYSKDVPDSMNARGDAKPTCEGYGNCKECECDPQCAWCIDGGLCNKYCMGLDGEMSDGSNAIIVGSYMCRQIEDTENNHMDVDPDNYYHHGGIADWKKKEKYPIERAIDNAPSETALKKRAYSPFVYVEKEKPETDKNKHWGNKPYWRHMWNKGAEMGLPKEAGILKGMDPAYPVPAPYGRRRRRR